MGRSPDSIAVVYVEPDEQLRGLVSRRLESADDRIDVTTTSSPDDAVEAVRSEAVDCVVSDYGMAETTGIDLLETVRENCPELPFVLFTGKGSEEVASEAIAAGVTDYLQKGGPGVVDLLADKVVRSVEQYRATRAARETEQRFRELAANANDVFWVFTADWDEVLFVNDAYEDVYGRPVEELYDDPATFLSAVHPDDREYVEEMTATLSEGRETEGEYRVNEATDYERWVWVQAQPIFEDGDVVRIVGFSRDVTERKEREQQLALHRRAMDEAPIGITISDPDREDNPLVYANDGFVRLTGYPESEVLGRNCRFLQGEATRPEPVAELRRAIDQRESTTVELRNYRADGTEFWNEVTVAPVVDDGTVTNFVGFQHDVTDRKRREDLIEVLNRVLRHNLRNDMNAVHGFAELLIEELPSDAPQVEYAETIKDRAVNLVDLTETAGQLEATLREIESPASRPLEQLVDSAVTRTEAEYSDATIRIDWSVDPDLEVAETVAEALVELLDNALQHTDVPEVTVTITSPEDADYATDVDHAGGAAHVDDTEHADGTDDTEHADGTDDAEHADGTDDAEHADGTDRADGAVLLEVCDSGPGIPEQERHVLESGQETQLKHGSGLGLWLVYWIVTGCGGSVSVPESDDGATVALELPAE